VGDTNVWGGAVARAVQKRLDGAFAGFIGVADSCPFKMGVGKPTLID
jgi:hypothetical protein